MTFEKCFESAFKAGLSDIDFFVRPNQTATLGMLKNDKTPFQPNQRITLQMLKNDAMAFQQAIENGDVRKVHGVD